MHKTELQALTNKLKDVFEAANWRDMFTPQIRMATFKHRHDQIAHPLSEVIKALQKELDKRERNAKHGHKPKGNYRSPYKED